MTLRYVIASTGRSGSNWIAKVLSDCGLRCGNEKYWNPEGHHEPNLMGDSSWMSAPDLRRRPGLVRVHQVRHPLDVARSLAGGWRWDDAYGRIRRKYLPDLTGEPLIDAPKIVLQWNKMIEPHCERQWQVEAIDEDDILWLAGKIGAQVEVDHVAEVLNSVPTTIRQHDSRRDLRWEDFPDVIDREALMLMALRYGYSL